MGDRHYRRPSSNSARRRDPIRPLGYDVGMTDPSQPNGDEAAARQQSADDDARRDPKKQDRPGGGPAADGRAFVGTGFFWGLVIGLVLAALVIILAAQNTASVTVRFLGWEISTPLIVLILGSLFIGIVLDEIAGAIYRRRRRRILNERAELERLRNSSGKG